MIFSRPGSFPFLQRRAGWIWPWGSQGALCGQLPEILDVAQCADQTATWLSQECLSFYKGHRNLKLSFCSFHLVLPPQPHAKSSTPFSLTEGDNFWVLLSWTSMGVKWMTAVFLLGGAALWHPKYLPCRIPGGWLCYVTVIGPWPKCHPGWVLQQLLRLLLEPKPLFCFTVSYLLLLFCCVAFLPQ